MLSVETFWIWAIYTQHDIVYSQKTYTYCSSIKKAPFPKIASPYITSLKLLEIINNIDNKAIAF